MLKKWVVTLALIGWAAAHAAAFDGHDFEPLSGRSAMRWLGIGPGPGYHSVPCLPPAAAYHRRVTNHHAPPPLEADYYPVPFGQGSPWQPLGSTRLPADPEGPLPSFAVPSPPRDLDESPPSPSDLPLTPPARNTPELDRTLEPDSPPAAWQAPSERSDDLPLVDELLQVPSREPRPIPRPLDLPFSLRRTPRPAATQDHAAHRDGHSREWW